jgi:hypothetical protein
MMAFRAADLVAVTRRWKKREKEGKKRDSLSSHASKVIARGVPREFLRVFCDRCLEMRGRWSQGFPITLLNEGRIGYTPGVGSAGSGVVLDGGKREKELGRSEKLRNRCKIASGVSPSANL